MYIHIYTRTYTYTCTGTFIIYLNNSLCFKWTHKKALHAMALNPLLFPHNRNDKHSVGGKYEKILLSARSTVCIA